MFLRKIFFILLFLSSAYVSAGDVSPRALILAQLTHKANELGVQMALINGCLEENGSKENCEKEAALVQNIDFIGTLEKVYREVFSQREINALYSFYSTDLGRKYSRAMLSLVAQELGASKIYEMPKISAKENENIKKFQASELSHMEASKQTAIRSLLDKHLSEELVKLLNK